MHFTQIVETVALAATLCSLAAAVTSRFGRARRLRESLKKLTFEFKCVTRRERALLSLIRHIESLRAEQFNAMEPMIEQLYRAAHDCMAMTAELQDSIKSKAYGSGISTSIG